MRKAIVVAVSGVIAVAAVAASVATADSTRVASPAAPSCKQALIALTGPYTGAAASAGADQLNWGRIFISNWNAGKPIPGVPPGTKRTKLKTLEADTALDAQLAATVAVQLRSNKDLLAVNGFSGSQENVAGGPILKRGGVPFVSGSATRASLTDPVTPDGRVLKKANAAGKILAPVYFRRVVPTEHALQLVGYFQDYQLTWSYLLDQLVAGLTLGSVYGLIAIGYSMVYGILKLLNFAHGEVFMIGSYIGYFTLTAFGGAADPDLPIAIVIALMFVAAMVGAGALGVVIERFAYRPLRKKRAPRIAPLISALGVSFCLQQLAVICFGSIPRQYDSFAFDNGSLFTSVSIGPFEIQYMQTLRHRDDGHPHGRTHRLHRAHPGRAGDARPRSTSRPRR